MYSLVAGALQRLPRGTRSNPAICMFFLFPKKVKRIFYFGRVNAILPGFIDTPIVKTVPDKVKEHMLKLIPLGRLGDPAGKYI